MKQKLREHAQHVAAREKELEALRLDVAGRQGRRRAPAPAPSAPAAPAGPDRSASSPARSRQPRSASRRPCRSSRSPRLSASGSMSASSRSGRSSASSRGYACSCRRSGGGWWRLGANEPEPAREGEPASRSSATDSSAPTAHRAGSRSGREREVPAQQHARRSAAEKAQLEHAPPALVSSKACSCAMAGEPGAPGVSPCPRT